jgi:IMP cyclohydrolase
MKKKSMKTQKNYLSGIEYPGRFIIGGQLKTGDDIFLVYGITGRSAASQARRLVKKENGIWVEPTDPQLIVTGNPDLLIYPAILYSASAMAVSNGQQTTDIIKSLEAVKDPILALSRALKDWKYEPDQPIYTPRISLGYAGGFSLGASVIKRGEFGIVIRNYFELPLIPGKGWLIMTYMGINVDPMPSFFGEPIFLDAPGNTAEGIASQVYQSLKPAEGKNDLRVAVACVRASVAEAQIQEIKIINHQEG